MILELMRSRRSIRRFRPEAPGRELVERLIEAAVAAPSASNKQPWRFLIVSDRDMIKRLADAVREATDRAALDLEPTCEPGFRAYADYFTRFESAPVVIVTLYQRLQFLSAMAGPRMSPAQRGRIAAMEEKSALISAALAVGNMLLMAHSQGLGAAAMTGPLLAADRVRELLAVADSWDVAAFVPVGFPAEAPAPPPRKPAAAVTRWIERAGPDPAGQDLGRSGTDADRGNPHSI